MSATIKRQLHAVIGAGPGRTGTTWPDAFVAGRARVR